jgi:hypothetical protein
MDSSAPQKEAFVEKLSRHDALQPLLSCHRQRDGLRQETEALSCTDASGLTPADKR